MNQHFANEKTDIHYTLQGDYYLPGLLLPEDAGSAAIGIYGERHRRYLKEHRRVFYVDLLTSGRLETYLADIDTQAGERIALLIKQMTTAEGVTEELKADNQMEWVGRMNNIRARAEEIVNSEILHI
ncbi:TnpV protein [Oscillospiraceae bacterium OttesenSCG-928-G22]|nr:TnpV protein [Oscillospiraceae bacterium OttesenSCG-928-G22]